MVAGVVMTYVEKTASSISKDGPLRCLEVRTRVVCHENRLTRKHTNHNDIKKMSASGINDSRDWVVLSMSYELFASGKSHDGASHPRLDSEVNAADCLH